MARTHMAYALFSAHYRGWLLFLVNKFTNLLVIKVNIAIIRLFYAKLHVKLIALSRIFYDITNITINKKLVFIFIQIWLVGK